MSELLKGEPPTGAPHLNPLTADDVAALTRVIQQGHMIADAIRRAHHIGIDVTAHAARHEMHQGVAQRIMAMYPPPDVSHLEE